MNFGDVAKRSKVKQRCGACHRAKISNGLAKGDGCEIFAAAFGSHPFYDLIVQARERAWPTCPTRIRY